jgi:hypothetical protein
MKASMKINVFWGVASCSLVETGRRFKGAYCLHQKGDEQAPLKRRSILPDYKARNTPSTI